MGFNNLFCLLAWNEMLKAPEDKGPSIWKPFSREEFPTQTSWVQKLNSSEALWQCVAWGVTPADTLEENRVLLKQFIKANSKAPPDEAVIGLSAAHLNSLQLLLQHRLAHQHNSQRQARLVRFIPQSHDWASPTPLKLRANYSGSFWIVLNYCYCLIRRLNYFIILRISLC